MRLFRAAASFLLFLFAPALHASELFPAAPVDEVSFREIPAFTAIQTEVTGPLDRAWDLGFRNGARYAALAHSGLNTPTLIVFPDWDKSPTAAGAGVHLLVQCLLDPLPGLPKAREPNVTVVQLPARMVACYAMDGAYSAESFSLGVKKIQDHLKGQNIVQTGPPQYLYYSTTDWMPSWWRVGEVQVPVAAGVTR